MIAACVISAFSVVTVPCRAEIVAGTPGPYGVSIRAPVQYASHYRDTLIECKPVARSGHFAGPFPAVMLIHGGAWSGGNNKIDGDSNVSGRWCSLWASWGFDAFSVGYRLTGDAPWPAQIEDVQAAIRYVRAHASSLRINPNMIVANGDSAGGQLAMIAGYSWRIIPGDRAKYETGESPQPQLVISQFGPWYGGPYRPPGAPSTSAYDYARQILIDNDYGRTDHTTPNTLFVQGDGDTLITACGSSVPAYKFLTGNGRPASYLGYNGDHEFTGLAPSSWGRIVGALQTRTISFAYARSHKAGVIPWSEEGPGMTYSDSRLPYCH